MAAKAGVATTHHSASRGTSSARLFVLQERVIREVEERMQLVSDDSQWKPPTQAAIDCGLHYTYIAHALCCGELTVAVQSVSTARGKSKLAVINVEDLQNWLNTRECEAEQSGSSLAKYLSDRYGLGKVFEGKQAVDLENLPDDLMPVSVAKQLLMGREIPEDILDDAIVRNTIVVYNVGEEQMVSEDAVVMLLTLPNTGDTQGVEIEDVGECDHSDAAAKIGVDPDILLAAIQAGECSARKNGEVWEVSLRDVITWYDTFYELADGESPVRYVLVSSNERVNEDNHYDTLIYCRFLVPDVPAIINEMRQDVIRNAVESGRTFQRGESVPVGSNLNFVTVELELSVGDLTALSYLAKISGHTPDQYMSLVAFGEAFV